MANNFIPPCELAEKPSMDPDSTKLYKYCSVSLVGNAQRGQKEYVSQTRNVHGCSLAWVAKKLTLHASYIARHGPGIKAPILFYFLFLRTLALGLTTALGLADKGRNDLWREYVGLSSSATALR